MNFADTAIMSLQAHLSGCMSGCSRRPPTHWSITSSRAPRARVLRRCGLRGRRGAEEHHSRPSAAVDHTELCLDKPPTVEARFASPDSYPPLHVRGTTLRGRLTPKITHAPHGSWRTLGELGLIVTLRQLLVQQPMAQARLPQPDAALQTHLLTHHTRCRFAVTFGRVV